MIVSLLFAAYLIFTGYKALSFTFSGSQEVIQSQQNRQHALSIMYRAARERSLIILQMSEQSDPFVLDELRQRMREQAASFIAAREKLEAIGAAGDRYWKRLEQQLQEKIRKNSPLQNRVADLFAQGRKKEADELLVSKAIIQQTKILTIINLMSKAAEQDTALAMAELQRRFDQARSNFKIAAFIGMTLFLVTFTTIIIRFLRGASILEGLLEHREIQYKAVVDTVNDGILTLSKEGMVSSFNHAAERIFDCSEDKALGGSVLELISWKDTERLKQQIDDTGKSGRDSEQEQEGLDCSGNKRVMAISINDSGVEGNQKLVMLVRDITEEKARYETLLKFKDIFRNSDDALAFIDMHHVYQMVNEKYQSLFNKKEKDIIGFTVAEVVGENLFYRFETYLQRAVLQDDVVNISQWFDMPEGKYFFSITHKPYHTEDGTIVGVVISIRDITQQKRAEEEAYKASKLESIGVLAGGIAHDFNNMLTGIMGNIEMAARLLYSPDKARKHLETSSKACKRAAGLTQQLLTFSKGGDPVKRDSDIMAVIHESAEFSLHGSNIPCHIHAVNDLYNTKIDSGQIGQVIQNLILNARAAMPEGGTIDIVCENATDLVNDTLTVSDKKHDTYVKITVTDTGTGIPEDIIDSVFDPYFSTTENGSGLGLALSYSIISKHNGYIFVRSQPGKGTSFIIYLPASEKPDSEKTRELFYGKPVSPAPKRILIMDDDEMIREIGQVMLEDIGHEVIHAENGEQAIELFKQAMNSGNPVDLVIMDLTVLGGMGGKEALEKILEIAPDVKAIVSSGYSNDPVMANFSHYGFRNAVSKPYNHEQFCEVVNATLMQG